MHDTPHRPDILAPAGDRDAFLAAIAAGADAVYLGLKHFSARMEAENFSLSELAALRGLAKDHGVKLYVAMNTLLKPGDEDAAGHLVDRLQKSVKPDALIVQDLGLVNVIRQVGFTGELHLSTLANISHPGAVAFTRRALSADRVILPRELSIDEIKACAAACPEGLSLEVFVHGALCYGVSGRCYWSSFLGGRSGLRGRCVQPCRRLYALGERGKGPGSRWFSCMDFSLDVLTKTLLSVPEVKAWKIEGRKKGPHYVFYTTKAYRLLRDEPDSPEAKKAALSLLSQALGRPGTRYAFLPQKKHPPVVPGEPTASGLLISRVSKGTPEAAPQKRKSRDKQEPGKRPPMPVFSLRPRQALLRGDILRVGYEDEPWHQTLRVPRDVPKGGNLDFRCPPRKLPRPGTDVFLIDRRETELRRIIEKLAAELDRQRVPAKAASEFTPRLPAPRSKPGRSRNMQLFRRLPNGKVHGEPAVWIRHGVQTEITRSFIPKICWWLPPVVWPDEEADQTQTIAALRRFGARHFVLNAPWQICLFAQDGAKPVYWAGPFCNTGNVLALEELRKLGFSGAFVSPELPRDELIELGRTSPLPLGIVLRGLWPLCVSRTVAEHLRTEEPLSSPMGEKAFVRRHGQNVWVYPGWDLDLTAYRSELEAAGYELFLSINESIPQRARMDRHSSTFNWSVPLL